MDLEFHQLDLRYERLRTKATQREKRLVASIADVGQLIPIVVVQSEKASERAIVIDGFKRIRALRRLHHDVVRAIRWEIPELQALLLNRSLRSAEGESVLEQAWLLDELRGRFALTMEELAQRFERSQSWVSRRLALLAELPEDVQNLIRQGRIAPHAAAKYLVPIARVKRDHCLRMARAIAEHQFSTRDVGELYAGWRDGSVEVRERLLADPLLFLRARRALAADSQDKEGPREGLLKDIATISAVAHRAKRRVRNGAALALSPLDHEGLSGGLRLAHSSIASLLGVLDQYKGGDNARSERAECNPRTTQARGVDSEDRPIPADLPQGGAQSDCVGISRGPDCRQRRKGRTLS